jgi:hypothetical protein
MMAARARSSVQARRAGRRPVGRPAWCAAAAGLCAAVALAGCGQASDGVHALGPSRTYAPVGESFDWNATAEERHGISARDFGAPASATAGAPLAGASELHWRTPAGWTEKPSSAMRQVNLQVAGDPRAECYLTTLPGEAGGADSNINRWRAQLSLPPLAAAGIAALPRVPWLGDQAIYVDLEGTWTGMSGDAPQPGWRLVGLVLVRPDQSRFLKMVGPADVIAPELAAFRAFADSFEGAPPTAQDEHRAGEAPAGSSVDEERAGLTWNAPPGWRRGPDKPMREVTYFAGDGNAVECYVTLLDGDAGGVLANVNRWCAQMGAPPLSEDDVAQLERLPMAGTDGVLVRIERGEHPGVAESQELLEGAMCMLGGHSLFVKMAGPRDAVEAQHAALLAFCRSMRASL